MTLSLTERQTLNFIEDYKNFRALWDPTERGYTNKTRRSAAYDTLCRKYGMTVPAVKSKIKNLRSYFLKEQQKTLVFDATDPEPEPYRSPWFAYDAMSFIAQLASSRVAKQEPLQLQMDYAYEYDPANADEGEEVIEENLAEILDEADITGVTEQVETEDAEDDQSAATGVVSGVSADSAPAVRVLSFARARAPKRKAADHEDCRREAEKDECAIFGEMVAAQMRSLSQRNRAIARNKIQNLIFELEMQELDQQETGPAVAAIDY